MKENIKSILIYSVVIIIIIVVSVGLDNYQDKDTTKIIKNVLQKYFENNNQHISSHDFKIDDVIIKCVGNGAYLVEFDLLLEDDSENSFEKLGATIYREDEKWTVKGFGKGLTANEIKTYNFRCHD